MAWELRPYQREAIDSTYEYWAEKAGNPLIVVPTGGGKSGIAGTITKELIRDYSDMRIVDVTHVGELVQQNHDELLGMWDWAPCGIYSAGLGRKEMSAQLLFASIQSIYAKAEFLGHVDLLKIDEAHLVPRKSDTQYRRFIDDLRKINPDMKIAGFTATPFRMSTGMLTEGEDAIFDDISYEVPIRFLMDEGYLTRLTTLGGALSVNTKEAARGVATRGGEYVPGQLADALDIDEITRAAVAETLELGGGRRSALVFAAGVQHAHHIAAEIKRRGRSAEVVHGEMGKLERALVIERFKRGEVWALVNDSVLTTGFNAPGVDLLVMLRPTKSPGLYIQICGRGTRCVYAPGHDLSTAEGRLAAIEAGPKSNCLVLDFARNIRTHGPVDMVKPKIPGAGKGQGEPPMKECPTCHADLFAGVMECPECGHEFERTIGDKLTESADVVPILSGGADTWVPVSSRAFYRHEKFGAASSVRVDYLSGLTASYKEWVPVENPNGAGIVRRWWTQHGGLSPVPETVAAFLERTTELRKVREIRVKPKGKYWEITGRKFSLESVEAAA